MYMIVTGVASASNYVHVGTTNKHVWSDPSVLVADHGSRWSTGPRAGVELRARGLSRDVRRRDGDGVWGDAASGSAGVATRSRARAQLAPGRDRPRCRRGAGQESGTRGRPGEQRRRRTSRRPPGRHRPADIHHHRCQSHGSLLGKLSVLVIEVTFPLR